jgi:glycerol-3-phosphate dehydrogenase
VVPRPAARHNRTVRVDPRSLHGSDCDLLVVGAGVGAAAIARDAALRGLAVVLCAAGDLGDGVGAQPAVLLSAGSSFGETPRASERELVRERELMLRLAPHLVQPVPVLVPRYGDGAGLPRRGSLPQWLVSSWARRSTLPGPRGLSVTAAVAAFPGLRLRGLHSAVVAFAAVAHPGRLGLGLALAAAAAGAKVATHCRIGGVTERGVTLVDGMSGAEVVVRARHVANVGGAGVDAVRRALGVDGADLVTTRRRAGIVLAARAGELALAAQLPDGRVPLVVPQEEGTVCTSSGRSGGALDLAGLLATLEGVLDPAPRLGDVRWSFHHDSAEPRRGVLELAERLPAGELHSVVDGELAMHRATAERLVGRWFGAASPSPTRAAHLPGGDGPREVTDPLWWRLGSRAGRVRAIAAADPAAAQRLCPHRPFLAAEAVAALQCDGAVTFADLLLRRLAHVCGPCLERDCLRAAHAWFVRARRWPVDDDEAAAVARLRAELAVAGSAVDCAPLSSAPPS